MKKSPNYKHVYFVEKGEVVEGFEADMPGWIWFNEAGGLGEEFVYASDEEADFAIQEYVRNYLNR